MGAETLWVSVRLDNLAISAAPNRCADSVAV